MGEEVRKIGRTPREADLQLQEACGAWALPQDKPHLQREPWQKLRNNTLQEGSISFNFSLKYIKVNTISHLCPSMLYSQRTLSLSKP